MSTGRNICPPEWAIQLTNLIQAIAGGGCAGLPLLPLCDANGVSVGYAAAVYNGASNQVTVLKFDANLQPVSSLATNLHPCPTGSCPPTAQHFQTSDLVCVDTGAGVIHEARQVITRDATGAIVNTRLEDPAIGVPITGAIVNCPC
jgi:hypothetical protein